MEARTSKLAAGLVVSKPDDLLAAVDIYSGAPVTPLNAASSDFQGLFGNAVMDLQGFLNNKSIGGLKNLTASIRKVTESDALKTLTSIAKNGVNINTYLPNLKVDLLKSAGWEDFTDAEFIGKLGLPTHLTKNLSAIVQSPGIQMVMSGHKFIKQVEDIDSFRDFGKLVAGMTGDESFLSILNLKDEFNVFKAVLDFGNALGLEGTIDKLIESYTDDTKREFLLYSLEGFVQSGNLEGIESCMKYARPTQMLAVCPQFVTLFLTHAFYSDSKTHITQANADRMSRILTYVNPNWFRTQRGNTMVNDLTIFQDVNPNILALCLRIPVVRSTAMLAGIYQPSTFNTLVKTAYPLAAVRT